MAFVLTFSLNTYNSVLNLNHNLAFWGFDNSDVYVSREGGESHDQVMSTLKKDDRVRAIVPRDVVMTAIADQGGIASTNVIGFSYHGDMDAIEMLNLEGRHPERENEISISVLTAEKYNKSVGDTVDVYIEGERRTYLITGIYQSLNGGGFGFRIQESALQEVNPDVHANTYAVKLHADADPVQFARDMQQQLGQSYNVRTAAESGEINFSAIT
ncbi:MAG: hypothetical protein FH749_04550 [Firmicutes bacterium]|nr:hypothetical protein [Bacillota bacterium]